MEWFNYYGLIIMAVVMIPNIIFALKHKGENFYKNRAAFIAEQIGRYGCFFFMIFNIPFTWTGYWFLYGEAVYLIGNGVFLFAYCLTWGVLWKKSNLVKALLLSVLPSLIFFFSGIVIGSVPLVVCSIVFAASHILISVKNL